MDSACVADGVSAEYRRLEVSSAGFDPSSSHCTRSHAKHSMVDRLNRFSMYLYIYLYMERFKLNYIESSFVIFFRVTERIVH